MSVFAGVSKRPSLDAGHRPSLDAKKSSIERVDSEGHHPTDGGKPQKNLVFSYAGPKQLQQVRGGDGCGGNAA